MVDRLPVNYRVHSAETRDTFEPLINLMCTDRLHDGERKPAENSLNHIKVN